MDLAGMLSQHIERLAAFGPRHGDNPVGVARTHDYLSGCLASYGYDVEMERYGPGPHEVNLLAALAGDGPVLEIGAHWDTVAASPGADDNASGVAGVLELAHTFGGDHPGRALRFCFFGGEEDKHPGLTGSRAHVAGLDDTVEGVIVLEMIAYRDRRPGSQAIPPMPLPSIDPAQVERGDFIAAVGNSRAADALIAIWSAAREQDPPLPVIPMRVPDDQVGHATRSDHYPYWLSGRMGVMVTDTAEFRNPHYHRPTDSPDTLDFDFAAQVTTTVAAAIRTLSSR